MALVEILGYDTCKQPSSRINNEEGVRPPGLYAIKPYCMGYVMYSVY